MPVGEASIRALRDREIMLTCLVEAVRDDPADAGALGRVLEVRIRATRARRGALLQRAQARAMRAEVPAAADDAPGSRAARGLLSRLAIARLVLELRRADLAVSRAAGADVRSSARALRSEALQVRRHARRRRG